MMKISEIPSLIHVNQAVSLNICEIAGTLARFESSYGLDLDPEFQRGHVWDLSTKIKFVEFILRGGVPRPILFNGPAFSGARHEAHSDLPETIVLVDGKQRLSAITDFIDNKLPVFNGHFLNDFDNPKILLRRTTIYYQVNKLQTSRELCQWYLEMNEGQVAHTAEELQKVRDMIASKDREKASGKKKTPNE